MELPVENLGGRRSVHVLYHPFKGPERAVVTVM